MSPPTVFVIDDDPAVLESLEMLLSTADLQVRCFDAPQSFLDRYDDAPGCVVTDLKMPGMNGIELQQQLQARDMTLPVIVLTGFGKVSDAVSAMKHGAVDFIQKPFDPSHLLEEVRSAIDRDALARAERAHAQAARRLLCRLTDREREVMDLVAGGSANKVIAVELGISERTVELHRSRVMKKTGSRSLADLMRTIGQAQVSPAGLSAGDLPEAS